MKLFDPVDILIVEDNPNDAELTIRALKKSNLANHIFVAENGEEALDFIYSRGKFSERDKSKTLKVIFLDLKLPKVDGLEVLRRMRTNDPTCRMPVVVLTSSREEGDITTSYQLGASSYIVKPVDFQRFMEIIRTVGLYWLTMNEPPPGP